MITENQVKDEIKLKFTHLSDSDIDILYQSAVYIYCKLLSPFKVVTSIETERVSDYRWIYLAMVDMIERNGVSSATAYSENGMSITFDGALISDNLKKLIMPRVGTFNVE